ncbi:MAG: 23S rRNA (pseudouridine(1915)-N(3))-methyltransferase RlmH [Silvanigrellaceae bacterium]|nr:23S rRNA (pseudouridine(1915)-N(3))-methyltransferase RlmH [Silvanigrellaceae bacterium]
MKYIFITPWKTNTKSMYLETINEFISRIKKQREVIHICSEGILEEDKVNDFYTKQVKKIGIEKPLCIAFDENGKQKTSNEFASLLERFECESEKVVLFCFGTSYGLPAILHSITRPVPIALSRFTFPHELAYAIALEQIYRANCIIENRPYHHGKESQFIKACKV